MDVPPIGWVVMATTLTLLLVAPRALWVLTIYLLPFQAASVLNVTVGARQTGVAPVILVLLVTCVWEVVSASGVGRSHHLAHVIKVFRPALLFVGVGLLLSVVCPQLFRSDLLVTLPQDFRQQVPLEPTTSNIIHSGYLALCTAAALFLSARVGLGEALFTRSLLRAIFGAVTVALCLLFWQGLSLYAGIWYPLEILNNNPGVVHLESGVIRPELGLNLGIRRISGSFSEPSTAAVYFGCYLALLISCVLYERRPVRYLAPMLLVGCGLFATGATTGFLVIAGLAVTCAWILLSSLFRRMQQQTTVRVVALALIAVVTGAVVLIALYSTMAGDVETAANLLLFNKISEDARLKDGRSVVEMRSLQVFLDSWGLGVGLGSNLSFTTIGYIVSNTGLIGAVAFLAFLMRLRKQYLMAVAVETDSSSGLLYRGTTFSLLALCFMGLTSVEWLLMPVAWIIIGVFVGSTTLTVAEHELAQVEAAELEEVEW